MYDEQVRAVARAAIAAGESLNAISKRLGVSRSAVRDWRDYPDRIPRSSACPRCTGSVLDEASYAHLLGWYLGDGCLSEHRREVYALRIACDDKYPRLIGELAAVVAAVHASRPVHQVQAAGYTSVLSYWKHWPCLFPQHGVGPKHRRRIELTDWQHEIVAECPEQLLRGLSIRRSDADRSHSLTCLRGASGGAAEREPPEPRRTGECWRSAVPVLP